MSVLSICATTATALTALTDGCENIGQIYKFLFQRKYSSGTTRNVITISSTDPAEAATWTALKAAVDGTKVVVSPVIFAPSNEPGTRRDFGGDNSTPEGITIPLGVSPGTMNFNFAYRNAATIVALKTLIGEDLQFFIINEAGNIYGQTDSLSSPTTFYGFDMSPNTFWVNGRVVGGLEAVDKNDASFQMPDDWADAMYKVTPSDFNAKTGL